MIEVEDVVYDYPTKRALHGVSLVVREGMAVHYKVIDVPALKLVLARPVEIG